MPERYLEILTKHQNLNKCTIKKNKIGMSMLDEYLVNGYRRYITDTVVRRHVTS